MKRTARISHDGLRRYILVRKWAAEGEPMRCCCFVMLNPSTADADKDDPTIRKCIGFATRLGYNALIVINLFAFRATDPLALRDAGFPRVDQENDWLRRAICTPQVEVVICAWGAHVRGVHQANTPIVLVRAWCGYFKKPMLALGFTSDGIPRHPLMLPYSSQLVEFK